MNKIVFGAFIAVLAVAGCKDEDETATTAVETPGAVTAPAAVDSAAQAVGDAAKAADATAEAAAAEAKAAAEAVEAAAAAEAKAAAEAAEAAAATEAKAAAEAAEAAVATEAKAAAEATEAAAAAAAEAADGDVMSWNLADMTAEDVLTRIEGADVSPLVKATLVAAYEQAKASPEALQLVLDQLKSALGM